MQRLRTIPIAGTVRFLFSACAGLILWAACASEVSRGSGESHFLECTTDAQCTDAGLRTQCVNRHCEVPPVVSSEGGANEGGADATDASQGIQCPPDCRVVMGAPISTCRDLAYDFTPPEWNVACDCSDAPATEPATCHKRNSDDTAWAFAAKNLLDPNAWRPCTAFEEDAASISCLFLHCERMPRSLCSLGDLCKVIDCGGPEFDEEACHRKTCFSDDDCASDERCVFVVLEPYPCAPDSANGQCLCATPPPGPSLTGNFCNPIATAGQRGSWTQVEVELFEGTPSCTLGCTSFWHIGPDGGLAAMRNGEPVSSTLGTDDLLALKLIVDGPEFRPALRDGIACGPEPTETVVTFRMRFGSATIERVATGCAISGPTGNVFERLYNLVEQY